MEIKQNNNEKNGEFVAIFDGQKAGTMTYQRDGADLITIDHTEVEQEFNGKGVGKELLYKAVEFARENNLKIVPLCPFAKVMFQKNKEIRDVLA
ncbi:GNAT family N-acetyltransferase [Chryseobacterium sp. SC28]|uniref:GNAT family N-acetyltransferase n=1 Tax=Chryseobacterium sp. SC28 TaxID=2268028 RepID=UPI00397782AC